MDKQFDDLSKSLAQGVSRREALRKFGLGLAAMLLAFFGIGSIARANLQVMCESSADCGSIGLLRPGCCKGICVDLASDGQNCGQCSKHCKNGVKPEICYGGTCMHVF